MPPDGEIEAGVVVVGVGAAGARATLRRLRGAVRLDRFTGGGTTALSGGVVYADSCPT
ncbi:MAG TPA: hypothetical protein VE733_20455 [Streptosporangiaceae bacterium]|nr:hypothetical protein [Streptosporangiaceae bacterium]